MARFRTSFSFFKGMITSRRRLTSNRLQYFPQKQTIGVVYTLPEAVLNLPNLKFLGNETEVEKKICDNVNEYKISKKYQNNIRHCTWLR